MSILVATNLEVIKEVDVRSRSFKNVVVGKSVSSKSSKDKDGICCLCWKNSTEESVIYATASRKIKEFSQGSVSDILQCDAETEKTKPIGICSIGEKSLAIGFDDGRISVTSESSVQTFWKTGTNLSVLQHTATRPNHLLSGGRENDVKLWDLKRASESNAAPLFTAKNVPPDELCLKRPIWVTDARFHPDGRRLVVVTGHGEIRLYDPSTPQRRPVLDWRWGESPITCMALHPRQSEMLLVGNSTGDAAMVELGKRGVLKGKFKKIGGALRGLACRDTGKEATLVSISSDRFLRIHNLESREVVSEVYLKLRPTSLLCSARSRNEEEEEDVWDVLESVTDVKRKRKSAPE